MIAVEFQKKYFLLSITIPKPFYIQFGPIIEMQDLKVERVVSISKGYERVNQEPFLLYEFARYIASFVTMTIRMFCIRYDKNHGIKNVQQESSSFSPFHSSIELEYLV